jgi:hypothetical protein
VENWAMGRTKPGQLWVAEHCDLSFEDDTLVGAYVLDTYSLKCLHSRSYFQERVSLLSLGT